MGLDWAVIWLAIPLLARGLVTTLEIGALAAVLAVIGGFSLGLASLGNTALLRQSFTVTGAGTLADWRILLQPRDPALGPLVREVRLSGGGDLRVIQTVAPNGDTDTLTVTPLP